MIIKLKLLPSAAAAAAAAACPSSHRDVVANGHQHVVREADELKQNRTAALLSKKKLILVLDLDHTLLHSRSIRNITKTQPHLLSLARDHPKINDPESPSSTSLFRSDSVKKLTKLRPFVRAFLREASDMFSMCVYTMGGRSYADEMVKILDPGREYFSKVIAKEDCTTPGQKGLDVVSGEERAVVVVDDTEQVWERHRGNLIRVERYDFFGKSSSELRTEDDALAKTLALLKKVHARFFDPNDGTDMSSRDTREVLKRIREEEEEAMCTSNNGKRSKINLRLKFGPRTVWLGSCSLNM